MNFNVKKRAYLWLVGLAILAVVMLFIFNYYCFPLKYKKQIVSCALSSGVEPALVASIIRVESSFKKDSISSRGAVGLMQLMPSTAEWVCLREGEEYSEEKLSCAEFNIKIGTYYLKYLLNKFGSLDSALVAYNAGEGRLVSWLNNSLYSSDGETLKVIPYKETSDYLKKVKISLRVYRGKL